MATYRVKYEIDVEADNTVDAAKLVHAMLTDGNGFRPIFEVEYWNPKFEYYAFADTVDLNDLEENDDHAEVND